MFINSINVLQYVSIWVYLIQNAGAYTPSGYLGCYEDTKYRNLNGKVHSFEQNSGDYCKRNCKGFRYAGTEGGSECYCGNLIRIKQERNDCNHDCPGNPNEKCGGDWRISIYDTWPCANLAPCKNHATCVNTDADKYICKCSENWTGIHCDEVKTSPTSTTTTTTTLATTEATSGHTINITTSLSPSSSGGINGTDFPEIVKDDIGSVVIPAVLVSVFVVTTLAVIVFLLWRWRRQLRSHNVTGGNSGISTTNMHYEDLRPDHSAESGYTEYLHSNLTAEETAGSVYPNIDSLPEDQTECNSYEHLQMQTTQPIDGYYMDIAANHINVRTSFDATYTNTPYDANAQELRNDEENEM